MKTQKLKISMVLLLTWGAGFALLGGWAQGEKAENRFFGTLFFTATSNSYSLESSFTELKMDCKFETSLGSLGSLRDEPRLELLSKLVYFFNFQWCSFEVKAGSDLFRGLVE